MPQPGIRPVATRASTSGKLLPTDTFAQSSYTRWTTTSYTDCCHVASQRTYHTIPASGPGTAGTNYDETQYGYDVMKRRNRTVSPGGTITFNVFNSRGLVTETWIGTNDNGATPTDPSGGGASGNNMVRVTSRVYDGGTADAVAKAYLAFADSFGVREWLDSVAAASTTSETVRLDLMLEVSRLGRSVTRWILRHHRELSSVGEFVERYRSRAAELIDNRHMFMSDIQSQDWRQAVASLVSDGVPEPLAQRTARAVRLSDALPIIDAADQTGAAVGDVAGVYVELSQTLSLDWLSEQLAALSSASHWQASCISAGSTIVA